MNAASFFFPKIIRCVVERPCRINSSSCTKQRNYSHSTTLAFKLEMPLTWSILIWECGFKIKERKMGIKIWKKQCFKNREIGKSWTDFCPTAWELCLCLWGCAFPAKALTQPTPAPETSKEAAADRKCSSDLHGDWAAMSEQPDEYRVFELRIWGPPDAAGKWMWGFYADLHWI